MSWRGVSAPRWASVFPAPQQGKMNGLRDIASASSIIAVTFDGGFLFTEGVCRHIRPSNGIQACALNIQYPSVICLFDFMKGFKSHSKEIFNKYLKMGKIVHFSQFFSSHPVLRSCCTPSQNRTNCESRPKSFILT